MSQQNDVDLVDWVKNYARNDTKAFVGLCLSIALVISFMVYVKTHQRNRIWSPGLLGGLFMTVAQGQYGHSLEESRLDDRLGAINSELAKLRSVHFPPGSIQAKEQKARIKALISERAELRPKRARLYDLEIRHAKEELEEWQKAIPLLPKEIETRKYNIARIKDDIRVWRKIKQGLYTDNYCVKRQSLPFYLR